MRPALPIAFQMISFWACLAGAQAQDATRETGATRLPAITNEFRLGVMRHDPWSATGSQPYEKLDIHGEILLRLPLQGVESALIPRFHLGGSLNLAGRTSHAFAGLAWTHALTERVFAEVSLGGAITGAPSERHARQARSDMGCAGQFREALSLGYRLDANWSVMGNVEHLSNAGLCARNRGMTNVGVLLGYRF